MDRNRTVAGLDVHKDSIYLCIMGHDEAIIFEKTYGVLTPELRQMCQDMVDYVVTEAAMESTAVYWVPVWNELCESMELKLVNPYFIKQLPGRKSDVKDAQWIAECLLKNLIRGSFVPEPIVQDMRKLNRRIMDLNEDMTYNCNKLDAALQRCGFRLSNYVSTIVGWCGLKPRNDVSNGRYKSRKVTHGRQIPQANTDRNRMGRFKNPELFLLQLQLRPDHCQEKEQDENSGSHSPQNTRRPMAHGIQRRGIHRHPSQKA